MSRHSLYGGFLRNVVLPIGDRWRGVPIGKALSFLEESQWWPPDKIRELQNAKLRKLIESSYAHVPYYRELLDSRGLKPSDIQSVDDLTKLPLLTQDEIRKHCDHGLIHQGIPAKDRTMLYTSGSTGEPKRLYLSKTDRAYGRAAYYRFLRWCGVDRGEKLFTVWGQHIVSKKWDRWLTELKIRFVTREQVVNAWTIRPKTMEGLVNKMKKSRAVVLRGYPASLVTLATYIEEQGVDIPPFAAVTTTAEPVYDAQRCLLEKVFRAPVFDQYGCGEANGLACECSHHTGLHIAQERCIVEVVNEAGERLPPGESGMLALTNLDNEVFPFIRYLCGDEAALLPDPCPCGRGLPLMTHVDGRSFDVIYGLNGRKVWGAFFIVLLMDMGWTHRLRIREFQFTQTSADHLRFDLVSKTPPSPSELEDMIRRVREHFGPMEVEYHQVDKIDRGRSDKLRYLRRTWDPNEEQ